MSVWEAAQSITKGSSTLWVVPCDCAFAAHRLCFEKRLNIEHQWCSLFASPEEKSRIKSQDLGNCPCCGKPFEAGLRLPLSFEELCRISWQVQSICRLLLLSSWSSTNYSLIQDKKAWKHLAESLSVFLAASAVYSLIDYCTQGPESGFKLPSLLLLWLFYQQTLLLQKVFLTDRFAQVVRRVWRGPIFGTYLKLYVYFVISVVVVFSGYSPILGRASRAFLPGNCTLVSFRTMLLTKVSLVLCLEIHPLWFWVGMYPALTSSRPYYSYTL